MPEDANTTAASMGVAKAPRTRAQAEVSAQFLPGTIVAGRYRMIGLLGRGGMGEVYRADDMKLGQPVALKFLPVDVDRDPDRLERFLSEVRVSLRVTHPNVCRVFDIGDVDGRHFLSMEFVDGEDLASLLRRIGRLPEDKAVELSRQLCAGLSAAHDEGVLHRDLKPANIMIDGRGRAKIADFGLAGATAGISGAEARAGTPQYMAPEQMAGGALTERTDLYALGLVLYEMFTGRRAYEATTFDELQRAHTSAPTTPTSHVSGLSPLVERAILRCLESDPAKRPASADALAAALPGGDPLAMAIAAGDTPSPEMVAAAGSDAGLKPSIAWPVLAFVLVGGLVSALLTRPIMVTRVAAPTRPPAVLVERAREIAARLQLAEPVQDSHWGWIADLRYLSHLSLRLPLDPRDTVATRGMFFWYRGSPNPFERRVFVQPDLVPSVSPFDPTMIYRGEHRIMLDREGRLTDLVVVPGDSRTTGDAVPPDWSELFKAAGLDPAGWTPVDAEFTPPFFADTRAAWTPRDGTTSPLRVQAASVEGRPVYFELMFPWTAPFRSGVSVRTPQARMGDLAMVMIFTAAMIGGVMVARRNLRLERADRSGATRLALFAAGTSLLVWVIDEHHVATIWELMLFVMALGYAFFVAALIAVFYLAVEPYVRRTWPSLIVSWSRVIAGRIRDPLVARDVLLGCAGGVLTTLTLIPQGSSNPLSSARPFLGATHVVSELANTTLAALLITLMVLFILLMIRLAVRRETVAIVVAAALFGVRGFSEVSSPVLLALVVLGSAIEVIVIARVGLVAGVASGVTLTLLRTFPFTWPLSEWYSGVGVVGMATVAIIAIAAFRVATEPHARAQGVARSPARA